MRWKYPFQPSVDAVLGKEDGVMDSCEREERTREREEVAHKPVAKPRVKVIKVSKSLKMSQVYRDVYMSLILL